MGLRAGLDAVDKRKIFPYCESNPGRPARSPSLYRLSYPDSFYISLTRINRYVVRLNEIHISGRGTILHD
jgi:hypothetical protein